MGPHEEIEDSLLIAFGDSNPLIANFDEKALAIACRLYPDHLAIRRMLHRIIQKVPKRTAEGVAVGPDQAARRLVVQFNRKAQVGDSLLELAYHLADDFTRIQHLEAILQYAGFHASEVEQPFHQADQRLTFAMQHLVIGLAARLAWRAAGGQRLGQLANGGERGAQFVGQSVEKVRLEARNRELRTDCAENKYCPDSSDHDGRTAGQDHHN